VLDDSEVDRATYVRYMQSDPDQVYDVIEAETLEEGLEKWRTEQPNIVLLDIVLPDTEDGLKFLEIIGEGSLEKKFPVVVMTGQGSERIAVRAMKLGAADFLVKGDITALSLNNTIKQIHTENILTFELLKAQQRESLIAEIALRIQQCFSLEEVLNTTVQEVRNFLNADRVLIYQFDSNMMGTIVAEAIIPPHQPTINRQVVDTYFQKNWGEGALKGNIFCAPDIYTANLTDCHIKLLEQFEVRANLVAPILIFDNKQPIWGLLIAHQCSGPRNWQEVDVQLLKRLSIHLAISIQQGELYKNIQTINNSLEQRIQERTKELQIQAEILAQVHDGVVSTDPNGIILSWNPGVEKIYGYTASEMIGQNIGVLYEDPIQLQKEVIELLLVNEGHEVEVLTRSKSGKLIYVNLRLSVMRDEYGNIIRLIGCLNDITARKQAEQELRLLNQNFQKVSNRLALALKSAAMGCWEWDIVNKTKVWDDRMYELYDLPKNAEVPLTIGSWAKILHPEDLRASQKLLQKAFLGEAEYNIEFRVIHSDRSIHFIKAYGVVIRDSQGNPTKMIGINFDITERKRAEELLKERERFIQQIADSSPNVLYVYNIKERKNTYINREVFNALGYSAAEVQAAGSQWLPSVIHPDDLVSVSAHFEKLQMAQDGEIYVNQYRLRHANGEWRYFYSRDLVFSRDQDGQVLLIIGTAQDITELKLTEKELIRTNNELARATRLKDEFLANMSHELRTPLNVILGMSESLQEESIGLLNERQRRGLKLVEKSGSHLLQLINDILDVSKIEAGMIELKCKSISVNNLCQSSLTFIKEQALRKNIQLIVIVPPNLPNILVDELRILQVLINLLNNAVKFTPEGGKITLEATQLAPEFITIDSLPKQFIQIAVIDTGIGIEAENIPKLFKPFVQIDNALNRTNNGTGLGLVLVKQIVELHGGEVNLTSELGRGSCFTIKLPCVAGSHLLFETKRKDPELSIAKQESSSDSIKNENYLILLVEDNESNVILLSEYLESLNYRIMLANNGEEAINITNIHRPDLILMDIQMPRIDGLEAIKQIRLNPNLSNVPIIAITALAMTGDRERCLAAGANEYISKPIKLKQLRITIEQFLQNVYSNARS